MRKILILAAILLSVAFVTNAQCDTKTTWMASKTEFIRDSNNVQSKPGNVTIITSKDSIYVITEDGEEKLEGTVMDYVCNWKDSTNGKINFKSELTDKQGKLRHATVTIESNDGKTTVLLEATEEQTKIRLPIDSYTTMK